MDVLAQNAEFTENEGRSVAFRRSASVLKALPFAVRRMEDLKDLPCLGEHSLNVIKVRKYNLMFILNIFVVYDQYLRPDFIHLGDFRRWCLERSGINKKV